MVIAAIYVGTYLVGLVFAAIAEAVPRRASVCVWTVIAFLAATTDLVSSVAWARVLNLSFQQYEGNPVAGAVGPVAMGAIQAGAFILLWLSCRETPEIASTGRQRLLRVAITALALRSTALSVWNAAVSLSILST